MSILVEGVDVTIMPITVAELGRYSTVINDVDVQIVALTWKDVAKSCRDMSNRPMDFVKTVSVAYINGVLYMSSTDTIGCLRDEPIVPPKFRDFVNGRVDQMQYENDTLTMVCNNEKPWERIRLRKFKPALCNTSPYNQVLLNFIKENISV